MQRDGQDVTQYTNFCPNIQVHRRLQTTKLVIVYIHLLQALKFPLVWIGNVYAVFCRPLLNQHNVIHELSSC